MPKQHLIRSNRSKSRAEAFHGILTLHVHFRTFVAFASHSSTLSMSSSCQQLSVSDLDLMCGLQALSRQRLSDFFGIYSSGNPKTSNPKAEVLQHVPLQLEGAKMLGLTEKALCGSIRMNRVVAAARWHTKLRSPGILNPEP